MIIGQSAGVLGTSGYEPQSIPVHQRMAEAASIMSSRFRVGDHVAWNSEAGRVTGRIIRIHRSDFDYKGHTHRASHDEPQYEIKSDKTDHIAVHRARVLTKIDD